MKITAKKIYWSVFYIYGMIAFILIVWFSVKPAYLAILQSLYFLIGMYILNKKKKK